MARIAYFANQFPSPLEPYVLDEIQALRASGETVLCSSARKIHPAQPQGGHSEQEIIFLWPAGFLPLFRALFVLAANGPKLKDLFWRICFQGHESFVRRLRALAHTWLGCCYALLLKNSHIDHIHVHHGYFASWIAMVAARVLNVSYSITLHGSDVLLHRAYLDTKLRNSKFCITISEFNKQRLLADYPQIPAEKIFVQRLGVDIPAESAAIRCNIPHPFTLLAVGRLHPVKDHAFLLAACAELKKTNFPFLCRIAGEGPERPRLQELIKNYHLEHEVTLLGQLSKPELAEEYASASLVVLTSRSEGIPLVLMEAMGRSCVVLAPDITGIPELVLDGRTGFLYTPGSLLHFAAMVRTISSVETMLGYVREAARLRVERLFERKTNLAAFVEMFLPQIYTVKSKTEASDADSVLQQVQLSF